MFFDKLDQFSDSHGDPESADAVTSPLCAYCGAETYNQDRITMREELTDQQKITISPVKESDAELILSLLRGTGHFQSYSVSRFLRNFDNPDFKRHQKDGIDACGFLLRNQDKPIGFTESVCREVFLKQTLCLACLGGTLYLQEGEGDSLPTLIYALLEQKAYDLNMTNTANKKSFEINRIIRSVPGPDSCANSRYRILSVTRFLDYVSGKMRTPRILPGFLRWIGPFLLGPILTLFRPFRMSPLPQTKTDLEPRQIQKIIPEIFDPFWNELLADNQGLLTSRRSDVLDWTFGKGLKTGRYSMLGRFDSAGRLRGVITLELRKNPAGKLFRVVDWIAAGKDWNILGDLLRDAVLFSRQNRGFLLELVGFEDAVQPLIAQYLPNSRPLSHRSNTFFIRFKEKELKKKTRENADLGWFYGPFDGDSCWV